MGTLRPVTTDLVDKVVLVAKHSGARRQRVRVTGTAELGSGLIHLVGELAYVPGGAYGPLDSRGFFSVTLRDTDVVEEIDR